MSHPVQLCSLVYSKPLCVQCDATRKRLSSAGIEFTEVDLAEHAAALEYVSEGLGYAQAPVVVAEDGTDENHWSGFRPDFIKALTCTAA